MENLKIRVFNEKESREAQDLFFELGAHTKSEDWLDNAKWLFLEKDMEITFSSTTIYHSNTEYKEVNIPQLRDMVVLNRKSWKDATHETDRDDNDDLYFVSSEGRIYHWFCGDHWVYSGCCYRGKLKPISKTKEDLSVDDVKTELTISDKVKYFEMLLNGKKLQYHLGIFIEGKSQWHNLTNKSLHVLQRPDVNIREQPKYVKLNGIEFKTKESLLKHVESNYDLS